MNNISPVVHTSLPTFIPDGLSPTIEYIGLEQIVQFTGIFLTVVVFVLIIRALDNRPTKNTEAGVEAEVEVEIDLKQGQAAMDYLERLILAKYNYYMYLELLPIYLDQKIPEKNTVKKVKERIYVSVVGSLTRPVKNEILKYFSEKGIEIFIHEKIMIHMNETDFQTSSKFSETFREINNTNIDKLI